MRNVITFVLVACALASTADAQESARLRGFSVVLLLGEQTGSIPTQGLSASAQRALADIKEFLPYKGYRVLDTQWVAGYEFGRSKGQIRGLEQKDFTFELETRPDLNLIAAKPGAPNGPLAWAQFKLVTPPMGWVNGKETVVTMLDNSFAIKPGETVVVGTSRLQGDSALIVLLTAVTAGK